MDRRAVFHAQFCQGSVGVLDELALVVESELVLRDGGQELLLLEDVEDIREHGGILEDDVRLFVQKRLDVDVDVHSHGGGK